MNGTEASIMIAVIGILLSIGTSSFISGSKWGQTEQKLNDLIKHKVTKADINTIKYRLTRIESLFKLSFRDDD
jgi:hypothetical protein